MAKNERNETCKTRLKMFESILIIIFFRIVLEDLTTNIIFIFKMTKDTLVYTFSNRRVIATGKSEEQIFLKITNTLINQMN